MRPSFLAVPLLAALSIHAQQLSTSHTQVIAATDSDCPVALHAQRRGPGQTVWTISQEDAATYSLKPDNSGVHVDLNASNPLRHAELAVFYLPPGARYLPITTSTPDQKKTFHLNAKDGVAALTADLLVGPTAGITRVHVLNLEFANGATWTAPNSTTCTIEPSGLLPVETH